jgi:hypothetical protein
VAKRAHSSIDASNKQIARARVLINQSNLVTTNSDHTRI